MKRNPGRRWGSSRIEWTVVPSSIHHKYDYYYYYDKKQQQQQPQQSLKLLVIRNSLLLSPTAILQRYRGV
jgi:hypothetical protein